MDRVDDDVDTKPAVRSYRLIHGAVQLHDQWFEVGALTSGPQADPGLKSCRRHPLEVVDPQVHPHVVGSCLQRGRNAGLAGARRTIENHDLARVVPLPHSCPPDSSKRPSTTRQYHALHLTIGCRDQLAGTRRAASARPQRAAAQETMHDHRR